jgi:hypothetical protein
MPMQACGQVHKNVDETYLMWSLLSFNRPSICNSLVQPTLKDLLELLLCNRLTQVI